MKLEAQTEIFSDGTLFIRDELENICQQKNTFKFYNLYFYQKKMDFFVLTQSGRIGGSHNSILEKFDLEENATKFFFKKKKEKIQKGYKTKSNKQLSFSFYEFP